MLNAVPRATDWHTAVTFLRTHTLECALLSWCVLFSVWLTWAPFGFDPPQFRIAFLPQRGPVDLVGNVLMLMPYGIVWGGLVRTRPVLRAALTATLLSMVLETGQLFMPRFVSAFDVGLNAGGSALGAALMLRLSRHWAVRRIMLGTFTVVFTAVLVHSFNAHFVFKTGMLLRDWDPAFGFDVGQAPDGTAAYLGSISGATFCAGAAEQICLQTSADAAARTHFVQTAERTQRFDFRAQVTPATLDQWGAVIAAFSAHQDARNFSVVQEGSALVLRIRTPLMGPHGGNLEIWIPRALSLPTTRVRVLYQDGSLQIDLNTAQSTRHERVDLSVLSSGLLLRGPGPITPRQVQRLSWCELALVIAPLVVLTGWCVGRILRLWITPPASSHAIC